MDWNHDFRAKIEFRIAGNSRTSIEIFIENMSRDIPRNTTGFPPSSPHCYLIPPDNSDNFSKFPIIAEILLRKSDNCNWFPTFRHMRAPGKTFRNFHNIWNASFEHLTSRNSKTAVGNQIFLVISDTISQIKTARLFPSSPNSKYIFHDFSEKVPEFPIIALKLLSRSRNIQSILNISKLDVSPRKFVANRSNFANTLSKYQISSNLKTTTENLPPLRTLHMNRFPEKYGTILSHVSKTFELISSLNSGNIPKIPTILHHSLSKLWNLESDFNISRHDVKTRKSFRNAQDFGNTSFEHPIGRNSKTSITNPAFSLPRQSISRKMRYDFLSRASPLSIPRTKQKYIKLNVRLRSSFRWIEDEFTLRRSCVSECRTSLTVLNLWNGNVLTGSRWRQ